MTKEEFIAAVEEYTELGNKLFEQAFRFEDDLKQAAKGQQSLDDEDTKKIFVEDR